MSNLKSKVTIRSSPKRKLYIVNESLDAWKHLLVLGYLNLVKLVIKSTGITSLSTATLQLSHHNRLHKYNYHIKVDYINTTKTSQ